MPDKFVDLGKEAVLWASQRSGDIELMLKRSRTNSRVNEQMARWIMAVSSITKHWRGKYKDLFGDIYGEIQDQYLNIEAYARKQAIELVSAQARASMPAEMAPEVQKRGGILGIVRH